MTKVFVSYKHNVLPDTQLAEYFTTYLKKHNHDVFIDSNLIVGDDWPAEIKNQLQSSDYLVVLLSELAIASEMILEEVRLASEYYKDQGRPKILPIRVAYTGGLPYDLGAMLNRIQYALWQADGDEVAIGNQVIAAIGNQSPLPHVQQDPLQPAALGVDGNEVQAVDRIAPPLPNFDPRWLDHLDAPGGAVRLQSPFYIQRAADQIALSSIEEGGVTVRIKGYHQMGKSSLLARLLQHAKDKGYPFLHIDCRRIDNRNLQNLDTLLLYFCNLIYTRLRPNATVDTYWAGPFGPIDKITDYLMSEVLPSLQKPLILFIDDVDRLFPLGYREDFFSLIRSWHDNRAFYPDWNNLNIFLAYSTEASMFIQDLDRSPFNVGVEVALDDFTVSQVQALNMMHGNPLDDPAKLNDFVSLFAGHPYLTRKGLFELVENKKTLQELVTTAANDDGPFSDHLHRYLWQILENPEVRKAMKSIILTHDCEDEKTFFKLRAAGLVKGSNRHQVEPRSRLYAEYLGSRI